MKININKLNEIPDNIYMGISFKNLMCIVFSPDGDLNFCSRDAIMALIMRLEHYYDMDGFGNPETGVINIMDAHIACIVAINHNYDI